MENENIFSILTVTLNQGKYIEETIKSVIFQEGIFFLEYLIIDGGSTDNTIEILEKYKKKVENKEIEIKCKGINFKYISEVDEGPTNALNKGLKLITGKIIGIINSDDIYPENALKIVWETFQKYKKIDIVYGDVKFIDEEGNFIYLRKGKTNLKLKDFLFENALIQPEVFIKKDVIEKVGTFDENFKFANDYEFWIRCIKNGLKFKYIPFTLAIFRKRKEARSASKNPLIFIDTLKVQFKYFGLTDFFLKNLGNYSAMFAYEVKKNIDVCFKEILKLLNSEISVDLSNNQLKKAIAESYLKFSIYQIYRNKVEGIKYYLQAIYTKPLIFLSKNSFLFLLRLITMREKIYYSLKFLFVRALEKL